MTSRSVGLASLAGLALLGAFWLGRASVPVGPAVPPPAGSEVPAPAQPAALEADAAELEALRERSLELAAQVQWLQAQLARLGQEAASSLPAAGDGTLSAADARTPAAPTGDRDREDDRRRRFDESELLAIGVPPSEVKRLRVLFEEIEKKRVAIVRKAEREGWIDTPRYQKEMDAFEVATREEVGDDSYDALLYATGQKNRVKIRVLLEDSPGRSFGLEPGDVVVSYDGRLMLRARELRRAAAQGEPGELVPVDVLRDGSLVQLQGLRGPIGARLQPVRMRPGAAR